MSDEDRKFLRSIKKIRPSMEVFNRLVQILKNAKTKTDNLLKSSLSKTI